MLRSRRAKRGLNSDDMTNEAAHALAIETSEGAIRSDRAKRGLSSDDMEVIEDAGRAIRGGGLVVFPTETVFGLGADAFNAEAVARIYSAKGRPGDNPLILHVANTEDFSRLAHEPPQYAFRLIEKFWPGPLTLVVRKNPSLPAWIGGHPSGTTDTIGIRMPRHPVAISLIRASHRTIAAPSANKAGKPSPTRLDHVLEDYNEDERWGIFFLDDCGYNGFVGLESTVVDVTGEKPVILRPGGVTAEEIFEIATFLQNESPSHAQPRSPGMKYKHYAPSAEMIILSGEPRKIASHILEATARAGTVGALVSSETQKHLPHPAPSNMTLGGIPGGDKKIIAQNFFANLREFDRLGVDIIYAESVCESGIGAAIMDRMRKAAEGRIINV